MIVRIVVIVAWFMATAVAYSLGQTNDEERKVTRESNSAETTPSTKRRGGRRTQTLKTISYAELKKELDGGFAIALSGSLKFTFDGEYDVNVGTYLTYSIYNDNRIKVATAGSTGMVSPGASQLQYNFDDNRYTLDLSGITGITANNYYVLEVVDSKGDKKYLKFLFKN